MGLFDVFTNAGYVNPNPGADQTVAGNARANFAAAVTNPISEFKEDAREKAMTLAADAKAAITEPFREVVSSAGQIAKKAIPTALASAATMQYTGGKPTFAAFLQPVSLRSRFLWAGFDRHDRIGYPLEDFRVLSTQSGFIQCENVRLDLAATATTPGATLEEQQLIKQYLEAGCYIE